jgi:hypothetical protein
MILGSKVLNALAVRTYLTFYNAKAAENYTKHIPENSRTENLKGH